MLEIIATVRRKLLGERLLRGLAVVLLATILASILFSYVLAQHNFSEPALFWTRLLGGSLLLLLLAGGVLAPFLRRRYSPGRLARFLEERNPQLEQGLSTVVEIREGQAPADPELRRLLERDVRRKLFRVSQPRFYDPRSSLLSLLTGAVSVLSSSPTSSSGGPKLIATAWTVSSWAGPPTAHFPYTRFRSHPAAPPSPSTPTWRFGPC